MKKIRPLIVLLLTTILAWIPGTQYYIAIFWTIMLLFGIIGIFKNDM